MDEQRALMDQLMGANRDLAPEEAAAKKKRNFWDPEIDKFYLCGLCPAIVFKNTKSESMVKAAEGICDDGCRKEWEALPQTEKDKYGYEHDLMVCLEDLISQCDKQIAAHKLRIEKKVDLTEAEQTRVDAIHVEVKEKTAQSEALGEKGEVLAAQAITRDIETLLTEKANIQLGRLNPVNQNIQRERNLFVCEVSGNFLCSTDNEIRLRNHFSGKMYRGWKEVRDRYEQLKAQNPPRVAYRDRPSGLGNVSPSSRSSSTAERRERERKRERRDTRERERDRERENRDKSDRHKDGHNDRERERRNSTENSDQSRGAERTERPRAEIRSRENNSEKDESARTEERRDRTDERERDNKVNDKRDKDRDDTRGGRSEKDRRGRRSQSRSRSRDRKRR